MSTGQNVDSGQILIYHEYQPLAQNLQEVFINQPFTAKMLEEVDSVNQILEFNPPDVILVIAEDFTGLKASVSQWLDLDPLVELILIPPSDRDTLMKQFDDPRVGILERPFALDHLLRVIHQAREERSRRARTVVTERLNNLYKRDSTRLIGSSPKICRANLLIKRVAQASNTPVLLLGESGTGKEVAAEQLHSLSPRAKGPFIKVNCASIPSPLMEDELFGHEKGSYTSAHQTRQGLFELADGGTILLDEIGDLGLELQPKLLRVLQDKTIRRVGGTKSRRVDVRVIAATHRRLEKMCRAGEFREDLFFRLAVLKIELPPLREREEDIILLANSFLQQKAAEIGRGSAYFTPQVLDFFRNYRWPGNVRELINMVERLIILSEGPEIDFSSEDLQQHAFGVSNTHGDSQMTNGHLPVRSSEVRTLEEIEGEYIKAAIKAVGFNKTKTAEKLGISRSTLRRKLKEHGLSEWADDNSETND